MPAVVLLTVCVAQVHGKGGGGGGGGGIATGGGGSAAYTGASSGSVSGSKAGAKWTPGDRSTAGGSSIVPMASPSGGGALPVAMSTRSAPMMELSAAVSGCTGYRAAMCEKPDHLFDALTCCRFSPHLRYPFDTQRRGHDATWQVPSPRVRAAPSLW